MKTIKLTADGVVKPFNLAHAQAILLHQIRVKSKSCWKIVDGEKYEFNGVEINAVKRDKKSTGDKAESMGSSAGKNSAK